MNNKTVVISGASGGIGIAISKVFYNEGYNIVLLYNRNKKVLEDEFSLNDKRVLMLKGDLSKESDVLKIKEEVYSSFNSVDIIVNNAGISLVKFFDETTCEEWDNVFDVNVKSAFMLTKAFLPDMINKKSGNIINISSMWGISGASMEVCYSASKAALIGMSKALAKEVGPSGINVNVVAPGVIDTKMNNHLSKEDMESLIEETPINRIGTPEDVANAVLFLCDKKASFITGEVISVDGGFIL
ncbi:elongation factor P 5-aminopentanone reductase [Anaerofustis butyriciformans]|uniref:elongation factor P 5-aminopentanone reductase n=1 Tax=Anaerofustis TaxID=264995 RepID=UPI003F8A5B58